MVVLGNEVTMSVIKSVLLEGKLDDVGALRFLRAEWQRDRSRCLLIRYAWNKHEQPLGLRLDIDKRVFLDRVDDHPEVDESVRALTSKILSIVAAARSGGQIITSYRD
jgi:hypothetical protein